MSMGTAEQQLHDRATRGEALSAAERMRLEEWYALSDRDEAASAGALPPPSITALQARIETGLVELAAVTQRIQALTAESAVVRQEIRSLQRQLTHKANPQPA